MLAFTFGSLASILWLVSLPLSLAISSDGCVCSMRRVGLVGLGKQGAGAAAPASPWKKLGLTAAAAVKKQQVPAHTRTSCLPAPADYWPIGARLVMTVYRDTIH